MRATTKTVHGSPCRRCFNTERYASSNECIVCCANTKKGPPIKTFQTIDDADDYLRINECALLGVFVKDDEVVGYVGKAEVLNAFLKYLSASQSTTQPNSPTTQSQGNYAAIAPPQQNQSITVEQTTNQLEQSVSSCSVADRIIP